VLRPFSVMLRPLLLIFFIFCYFLLLFLLLVTFWNYFLLSKVQCLLLFVTFFTVENDQGNHLLMFLHCLGGGGVPIHMICALRSQCAGLGVVWSPKTYCSAGLFSRSVGLFLLAFFTFCYFLLLFFIDCNFCKLLFYY